MKNNTQNSFSRKQRAHFWAVCLALCAVLGSFGVAFAGEWEEVEFDEGIRVWKREVPGSSLVEFKGEGDVSSSILKVAAVISLVTRGPEWLHNCIEDRFIQRGIKGKAVT